MKQFGIALIIIISISQLKISAQWQKGIIDENMTPRCVSVNVADMNGDNVLDLLVTNGGEKKIILYQNNFSQWEENIIDNNVVAPFASPGDMDGDDTLDVVACLYLERKMVWYENNHPTWTQHIIAENTNWNDYVVVADLNNDNKLDVVSAVTTSKYAKIGDVVWYENNHPTWTPHIIESDVNGCGYINVTDIDGDGILDVVASLDKESKIVWYKTEDEGLTWAKHYIDDNLKYAWIVNSDDINKDGKMDIVATAGGPYFNGSSVVWYENNLPSWTKHVIDTDLPGANFAEIADIDGDGGLDVIAGGYIADDVVWYKNNLPDINWNKNTIDEDIDGPRGIAIEELDGDGINDVIVAAYTSVAWYKNPYAPSPVNDYWIQISDSLTNVSCLANNSNDHIFANTITGVFRSTDNGDNWTKILEGWDSVDPPEGTMSLSINSNEDIFAGFFGHRGCGGVLRSTDNGETWMDINDGSLLNVKSLEINSSGDIFAGSDGCVFRSTDNGNNWTVLNIIGLTDQYINGLTINSTGYIIAATELDGIYRSIDNGDNWTQINNGLTNLNVESICINSSGDIFAGTDDGIFRSTNNGDSWTQINNGLTHLFVDCLIINSNGDIYAGTGGGVYQSTDNGNNWTQINDGLTNISVRCLDINSSGYLYAGTEGGLFRSINTITSAEGEYSIPSKFTLYQNYPNPFNPSTTIKYEIPKESHITLKVYDILGREVATLMNKQQKAGYYEVSWDAKNNSSGIYFYRIQAGEFVKSKKMILMK